jgi:hypothetical protein
MKSTEIGNLSLVKVMAACAAKNFIVSLPIGDGHPYDLIVDNGNQILKVQVKTGRLIKGALNVHLRSNSGRWSKNKKDRNYTGKVDAFASYCRETDQCFLIPIKETGKSAFLIRMELPKNNSKKINWAKNYLI